MSTQPLTEVERAALTAMMSNPSPNNCWCDWVAGDPPCDECSRAARAVVAAVRPLIAQELVESAEIVREFAQSRPITSTEAKAIFDGIATSLSRPTSEEH